MMRKEDINKIRRAGFTLIRAVSKGFYTHGWKDLEKGFETFKDVERRMNELLKDEKTIEL